jgi:hypothetical protein
MKHLKDPEIAMTTKIQIANMTRDGDGFVVTFAIENAGGKNLYTVAFGDPLPSEDDIIQVARHMIAIDLAEAAKVAANWKVSAEKLRELRGG